VGCAELQIVPDRRAQSLRQAVELRVSVPRHRQIVDQPLQAAAIVTGVVIGKRSVAADRGGKDRVDFLVQRDDAIVPGPRSEI
jgi:hypothetical protein